MIDGAASYACAAAALNWVADEFAYSVSGISLDLEKSSKYESLKGNFEERFQQRLELAKKTVRIVKGLQQRRYGVGAQFHLGPAARSGVVSIRSFTG